MQSLLCCWADTLFLDGNFNWEMCNYWQITNDVQCNFNAKANLIEIEKEMEQQLYLLFEWWLTGHMRISWLETYMTVLILLFVGKSMENYLMCNWDLLVTGWNCIFIGLFGRYIDILLVLVVLFGQHMSHEIWWCLMILFPIQLE